MSNSALAVTYLLMATGLVLCGLIMDDAKFWTVGMLYYPAAVIIKRLP